MSSSPLKPRAQQPTPANNAKNNASSRRDRLSLSQALLITAGLAGLVGLSCGVIIRFSLSKSSTARFLSPLQTFPSLSDWAPELPQGTADSHYLPGGVEPQDSIRNVPKSDLQQRQFESFADPDETADVYRRDPAESLPSQEPYLEESYPESPYAEPSAAEAYPDTESSAEGGSRPEAYLEPYLEEEVPESENPYYEEGF